LTNCQFAVVFILGSARAMELLISLKSSWIEKLPKNAEHILMLAAYLHNIGKSNWMSPHLVLDRQPAPNEKPMKNTLISDSKQYPEIGFQYIIGEKPYRFHNRTKIDLNILLTKNCELNEIELSILGNKKNQY
jgi:hypothetical protein